MPWWPPVWPAAVETVAASAQAATSTQSWRVSTQPCHQHAVHRSELTHRSRLRSQGSPCRSRSIHLSAPAIIPATREHDHSTWVRAIPDSNMYTGGDHLFQPDILSIPNRRHWPGMRHKVRVIKGCVRLGRSFKRGMGLAFRTSRGRFSSPTPRLVRRPGR